MAISSFGFWNFVFFLNISDPYLVESVNVKPADKKDLLYTSIHAKKSTLKEIDWKRFISE